MLYLWVLQGFFWGRRKITGKVYIKMFVRFQLFLLGAEIFKLIPKWVSTSKLRDEKNKKVCTENPYFCCGEVRASNLKEKPKQTKKLKCQCTKHYRNKKVCKYYLSLSLCPGEAGSFFQVSFQLSDFLGCCKLYIVPLGLTWPSCSLFRGTCQNNRKQTTATNAICHSLQDEGPGSWCLWGMCIYWQRKDFNKRTWTNPKCMKLILASSKVCVSLLPPPPHFTSNH